MIDDDNRLKSIERELQDHGSKLGKIAETLEKIAVQDERLKNLNARTENLEHDYKALCDNNTGVIPKITNHQASCPREQIKWMWTVIIGLSTLMLGIGVTLIGKV
jgi:hypothetical protein